MVGEVVGEVAGDMSGEMIGEMTGEMVGGDGKIYGVCVGGGGGRW